MSLWYIIFNKNTSHTFRYGLYFMWLPNEYTKQEKGVKRKTFMFFNNNYEYLELARTKTQKWYIELCSMWYNSLTQIVIYSADAECDMI